MYEAGKEYTTKSGIHTSRIYATDGWGRFCIHGALLRDGGWSITCWDKKGVNSTSSEWDILQPIVVTGDEIQAFRAATNIEPTIISTRSIIAGLEAAIRLHLSKRGGA